MLENTHPHLFNVAGSKDTCGDNTLRVSSRAKAPRLYGAALDKNDRSKALEFFRRFWRTVACEVLRSAAQTLNAAYDIGRQPAMLQTNDEKSLSGFLELEVRACVLDSRVDLGTRLRVCEPCLLRYLLFPAPVAAWLSAVIAVSESM
jgi:hypothetical protein